MARTVYLHVGAPKTGTTYLQRGLWANKDRLAEHGVLVPGRRRFDSFHAAQAITEVPWLPDLPPGRSDTWERMLTEIQAWPGVALLSHEFLGRATAKQTAGAIAALQPAEVHVVMTARDYVRQVPAVWQEAVKMGAARPLVGYSASLRQGQKKGPWGRGSIDVVDVLERWGHTLPGSKVHLVTVPDTSPPPELLWERFATACSLDPGVCDMPTDAVNQSLGAVEIELLRQVGQQLPESLRPKARRHRWLRQYLAHGVLSHHRGQPVQLPRAEAVRVRAWAEEAVERLGTQDYDVVGDLTDLVSAPLPDADPPAVENQAVRRAAVRTIGEIVDQRRLLVEQNRALRGRVKRLEAQLEQASDPRVDASVRSRVRRRVSRLGRSS